MKQYGGKDWDEEMKWVQKNVSSQTFREPSPWDERAGGESNKNTFQHCVTLHLSLLVLNNLSV